MNIWNTREKAIYILPCAIPFLLRREFIARLLQRFGAGLNKSLPCDLIRNIHSYELEMFTGETNATKWLGPKVTENMIKMVKMKREMFLHARHWMVSSPEIIHIIEILTRSQFGPMRQSPRFPACPPNTHNPKFSLAEKSWLEASQQVWSSRTWSKKDDP